MPTIATTQSKLPPSLEITTATLDVPPGSVDGLSRQSSASRRSRAGSHRSLRSSASVAVLPLPEGAAALLAKFKPFDAKAALELKNRIEERKKNDKERAERRGLEEAALVDGQIVVDEDLKDEDDELKEDPKLAEGRTLPKAVAKHFPKELIGVPLEDVDQRNHEYEETFLVINRRFNKQGYIYRFSATPSLWLFKPWNPIRRLAIYALTHQLFDLIVIFTILSNSIYLAMNVDESCPEYSFLTIYTLEGIVKIISRGFVMENHSYLRDPWNWLDFFVIITSYATLIAEQAAGKGSVSSSLKGLKALRVFRVVKTMAIVPGLKPVIEALMRSLKNLGDVLIMTLFFFTIFALFGLQLFQGTLLNKCVLNADSVGVNLSNGSTTGPSWTDWVGNSSNWSWQDNGIEYTVCGNISGAQQCATNYTCIQVASSPGPNGDFTKFDNFYSSFMIAIQIFNCDYWDFMYHDVIAANGPAAFLFFVVAVVFLTYYLCNLVQAVVALSYEVENDDSDDEKDVSSRDQQRKKEKRRFVFDPYKLREIRRRNFAERRRRSLLSVKNVTEKRFNFTTDNGDAGDAGEAEAGGDYGPKPLQVASRPPSAVSVDKLPQVGFWDSNPTCCFACCNQPIFFQWLRFQSGIMTVVGDPFFELFITATIVTNTVAMAAYYYQIPDEDARNLSIVNDICTYIFITEAVLKLTATCQEYFANRWNWLDFIVVIGSIIDIIFSNVNVSAGGFNIQIIRLLRLLRIFKLAQSWKTMKTLLEIILGTFVAIGNLVLLLFIVMFIFAIIGMQLFGGTYVAPVFISHPTFTPFPGFAGVPEWNWDDFFHAFMHVFRILCRETYQPMFDCISANSPAVCVPFYIATLIVCSYVVLNLFLAVLLNAFSTDDLKKKTKDAEDSRLRKRLKKVRKFFKGIFNSILAKCCPGLAKSVASVAPLPAPEQQPAPEGEHSVTFVEGDSGSIHDEERRNGVNTEDVETSVDGGSVTTATHGETGSSTSREVKRAGDCCWPFLGYLLPSKFMSLFDPENPTFGKHLWAARSTCHKICTHKAFEYTVLGFIFASSISLCLQDATLVDGSLEDQILTYMDYCYLGVFTVEMVLKIFAFGIRSYFTTFWTVLDFVIVATGFVDLGMSLSATSVNLSSLRALRTLRALRPLRAISRWQGMKIVVSALITAIPGIANVLLVVLIIWLIFAIMGVQFFAGKFWMCQEIATGNRIPRALVPDKATCLNNTNWAWTTYIVNFDNVANAYLALLEMATFEGWTTIFQLSVDSSDQIGSQPAPELNIYYYVYYIIFIIFCSFFLLNLFVGVIIDDFNALKKKYEGGTALMLFMTDWQKQYYKTMKQLGARKPRKALVKPKNSFGLLMFDIASSQRFEYAIVMVISANVILMATEHFNQDILYTVSQDMLNLAFTTIFSFEAILKIYGLRLDYFREPWNDFDFAVVIISITSIGINDLLIANSVSPSILRLLRVLRVGRFIRLFRAWKGVRKLIFSFIMSLPALFNVGCLLFLIMFIYAIIGINLFGHVGYFSGNLDDIANFHTFTNALLILFRMTTMSGWDNVHQGLSFTDDPASGCNPRCSKPTCNPCCNRNYWTRPNGEIVLEQGGWGNCGNYSLACFYVISYLLFTYFIIVNMFAAVILDNYQQATEQEDSGVTDDDIERFYGVWEQFDPLATQFIKFSDLSNFVSSLDPPLGLPKPNDLALSLLDFPVMKDQTSGDEVIHCLDVLMGVVRNALGFMDESEEDFQKVKTNLETVFKSSFPNRVKVQVISSTKQRKKEDIAARTIQKEWRKHVAAKQYHDQATIRRATAHHTAQQQQQQQRRTPSNGHTQQSSTQLKIEVRVK